MMPPLTMAQVNELFNLAAIALDIPPSGPGREWKDITKDPIGTDPYRVHRKTLTEEIDLIAIHCTLMPDDGATVYIRTSSGCIRLREGDAFLKDGTVFRVCVHSSDRDEDILAFLDFPVVG